MMKSVLLIGFVAILASVCLADETTIDPEIERAADELVMKRIDLAKLSQIRMETRHFDLATKCELFEQELRRSVGNHFGTGVSRNNLFTGVAKVLSRRKLPFGNSQPVLKDLEECLTVPASDIVSNPDIVREVIASPPIREPVTTESASQQAMEQAMSEFHAVKERVKDHGLDIYANGGGSAESRGLSVEGSLHQGDFHVDQSAHSDFHADQSVHGDFHEQVAENIVDGIADGVHHAIDDHHDTSRQIGGDIKDAIVDGIAEHVGDKLDEMVHEHGQNSHDSFNHHGATLEHGNYVDEHGTLNIKVHDDNEHDSNHLSHDNVPVHDARTYQRSDSSSYDSSGLFVGPVSLTDDADSHQYESQHLDIHVTDHDPSNDELHKMSTDEQLRLAVEREAELTILVHEKDATIAELQERVKEFDDKLANVSPTGQLIDNARFQLLKEEFESAIEREKELNKELDETKAKLREKELLVEKLAAQLNDVLENESVQSHDSSDDDDDDDDEYGSEGHLHSYHNPKLNEIVYAAEKLAKKMKNPKESLESRCQRYYMVFSSDHSLDKDVIKRIAKMNIDGVTPITNPSILNKLRHVGMLLTRQPKQKVQTIGHEMQQCFAPSYNSMSHHNSMGQWHSSGGHYMSSGSSGSMMQNGYMHPSAVNSIPPLPPMPPMTPMYYRR